MKTKKKIEDVIIEFQKSFYITKSNLENVINLTCIVIGITTIIIALYLIVN